MRKDQKILSKTRLINGRQCQRRLWLQTFRSDLEENDLSTESRLSNGNKVGKIARQVYADGVLIETLDRNEAITETNALLNNRKKTIFEAAFLFNDVLIRTDIIIPNENSFRLVEVKSSTSVKEYYIEDLAIQNWVMTESGTTPTHTSLAYINNQFIYPGNDDYSDLFIEEDLTNQTKKLINEIPKWIREAKYTLASKFEPDIPPGKHCNIPFPCPFQKYCSNQDDQDIEYPINILPNGGKLISDLQSEGYKDLRDVPIKRLTNPRHIRIHRVTTTKKSELDTDAISILKFLEYPRYYLDFETIAFAVPIWKGTSPYKQIPFQWSCHIEKSENKLIHQEFLDTSGNDPRLLFIEKLINALDTKGPIIVYNAPFEGSRMKELAAEFPQYSSQLLALVDRLFDLLPLTRKYYYHPAMKGSWSIKAVLPTITEISYENLAVSNGGMAQEVYLKLISSELNEPEKYLLKNDLLEYCKQDTFAMISIVKIFTDWNLNSNA